MSTLFDFEPPTFAEVVAYLSGVADGMKARGAGATPPSCGDASTTGSCPGPSIPAQASLPRRHWSCDDLRIAGRAMGALPDRGTALPSLASVRPPQSVSGPVSVPGASYSRARAVLHTIPYSLQPTAPGSEPEPRVRELRGIPCSFLPEDHDERPSRVTLRAAPLGREWYDLTGTDDGWT